MQRSALLAMSSMTACTFWRRAPSRGFKDPSASMTCRKKAHWRIVCRKSLEAYLLTRRTLCSYRVHVPLLKQGALMLKLTS